MTTITNPQWTAFNSLYNEGGEGYNPHSQYLDTVGEPEWSKLMDRRNKIERLIPGANEETGRYDELVRAELIEEN